LRRAYTNASFKGAYGFSIVFGANVAIGLGVAKSDGEGNFEGVQTLNLGGLVIPHTFVGSYKIDADGVGTASVTFKIPDGTTQQGHFDYVVLAGKQYSAVIRATELQGFAREPGLNENLGLSHFKLIP